MNIEKLKRLQAQVRIGGKGTPRRKKKVMHQTAAADDKKLQSSLKKLSVSTIPGIEEVNIIKDDMTVIHFNNPKAQASLSANTFAVTGHGETKKIVEMLPEIIPQLGQETVVQLRMFANSMTNNQKLGRVTGEIGANLLGNVDDDEVPLLVSDFDEIAKTEKICKAKLGPKPEELQCSINSVSASNVDIMESQEIAPSPYDANQDALNKCSNGKIIDEKNTDDAREKTVNTENRVAKAVDTKGMKKEPKSKSDSDILQLPPADLEIPTVLNTVDLRNTKMDKSSKTQVVEKTVVPPTEENNTFAQATANPVINKEEEYSVPPQSINEENKIMENIGEETHDIKLQMDDRTGIVLSGQKEKEKSGRNNQAEFFNMSASVSEAKPSPECLELPELDKFTANQVQEAQVILRPQHVYEEFKKQQIDQELVRTNLETLLKTEDLIIKKPQATDETKNYAGQLNEASSLPFHQEKVKDNESYIAKIDERNPLENMAVEFIKATTTIVTETDHKPINEEAQFANKPLQNNDGNIKTNSKVMKSQQKQCETKKDFGKQQHPKTTSAKAVKTTTDLKKMDAVVKPKQTTPPKTTQTPKPAAVISKQDKQGMPQKPKQPIPTSPKSQTAPQPKPVAASNTKKASSTFPIKPPLDTSSVKQQTNESTTKLQCTAEQKTTIPTAKPRSDNIKGKQTKARPGGAEQTTKTTQQSRTLSQKPAEEPLKNMPQ